MLALAGSLAAATVWYSAAWSSESPQYNYLLHCAGCHQADGGGLPDGRVPGFTGNLGYFLRTPEGRRFLVQVPGSSQSPMNDQDLAEVLNWMLREFSRAEMPRVVKPFTGPEVHDLRSNPLTDVAAERARILERLQSKGFPAR